MTSLGYYSNTTKNDAGDHVRKNTKNISFGAVRRCSFEHYTCHRNLGKLRKHWATLWLPFTYRKEVSPQWVASPCTEKDVRNPTTWSRLGLIDFSAKIFTVRMDWVKLVGIIFWKTVVNTSRRNLKIWISRGQRRRRWVLYLNDYGSNKEFGEFGRRVHQRCQFRRVMTLIFVGPSISDTRNLSRKGAFSMTITWNSWSDLFSIDVLLWGQQDT